jgi:hypothetical protein
VRGHKELYTYIHPDGGVLVFTIERAVKIIVSKKKILRQTEYAGRFLKVLMERSYVSRVCCGTTFVCFSTIKLETTSSFAKGNMSDGGWYMLFVSMHRVGSQYLCKSP